MMHNSEAMGRDESRRVFLRNATLAAGVATVAIGGQVANAAGRAPTVPALYPGWNKRNFDEIQADENTHVPAVIAAIEALGGTPRPKPTFQNLDFSRNPRGFVVQSQAFENTGVGAYLGAVPFVLTKSVLAAAGSIALVEAYHSGYLNTLLNQPIVPGASHFAMPLTPDEVGARVMPFIVSLNGGPAPTYTETPSVENDIMILNFALLAEYLEQEFYNLNVPRIFGS